MKTALIIAVVLLVVGALLVGAGWVLLKKNPLAQNTVKDANYPYGIDNLPTKIDIATLDSRVEILPATGEEWRVECKDTEKLYHTVELVDGVLTIRQNGTARKWYEYITLQGVQPLSVTVYLPEGTYQSLSIHSTSGSIKVREGITFSNASLQNTSGSITCSSHIAGALEVKNTSGSITVNGGVDGDLNVKNTSGSIEIKDATPTSVTIKNTSGGIDLYDVVCRGEIKVENTSGSIEFEHCDALSFDLRTTSGGIRGSILSAKTFDCRSISGGVHVPNNGNGGNFLARSSSGGIRITVVE